ncbi:hypothetical protein QE152_g40936, partial [Popillia japonica]
MTGAINLGEGDIMPPTQQAPSDKRPKLERAHSAAEKENQPLQRSGSVLRRQHSEQESPNPALDRYNKTYNEDDPRYYQGELEGLMRTHPHLVPRRYPEPEPEPSPMDISQRMSSAISANKKHKRSGSAKKHQHPPQPQLQRSFSSSEEDLKSTPEYGSDERDSEKGIRDKLKLKEKERLNRQAIFDEKIKKFLAVVWVCILCRKKQELLSKTGQWMTGAINLGEGDIMPPTQQAPSDKRPKLERAHSAAEKENQPLQRSGSVLRRQHSEQESPNPALDRYNKTYNEDDPRYYQGELEGLMRTHPHLVPRRYPEPEPEPSPMDISQRMSSAITANKKHKRSGSAKKHQHPPQPQLQRSFSSSEEDLKSTPEYGSDERDSEK